MYFNKKNLIFLTNILNSGRLYLYFTLLRVENGKEKKENRRSRVEE